MQMELVVAQGSERGHSMMLRGGPVIIGRRDGSLRLTDPKVSRRHAELVAAAAAG